MERITINVKPISVNDCWQGKRFKTPKYKNYERDMLLIMPKIQLPQPPYKISFEFGFSNSLCDWDNPVKPIQDILQKKYGFNDKDIYEATVKKSLVKKGQEYFSYLIESLPGHKNTPPEESEGVYRAGG